MAGHPKPSPPSGTPTSLDAQLTVLPPDLSKPRTPEEAAERRRAVTGSSTNLKSLAQKALPPLTPVDADPKRKSEREKKSKPTKWQFGIRSRNQPAEAMLAIYKALRAMGADWEVPRIRKPGSHLSGSGSRSRSRSRSGSDSESDGGDRGDHWSDEEADVDPHHRNRLTVRNGSDADGEANSSSLIRGRGRERKDRLGPDNDWGYAVPEDPWVIYARFKKDGMFPPGVNHPSSAQSSRVDLSMLEEEVARQSSQTHGSSSSLAQDAGAYAGPASTSAQATTDGSQRGSVVMGLESEVRRSASTASHRSGLGRFVDPDASVYVYLTIQLYTIDQDFFLVDFKCAGYENLVREVYREIKEYAGKDKVEDGTKEVWRRLKDGEPLPENWEDYRDRERWVGQGRATSEKRTTSPYPFLDVASGLIIQLAEGE